MGRKETYEAKTLELLKPIVEKHNVSIYDIEYVKEGADYYLRAYIDKPEGIDILDCEKVSRDLSNALDENEFIADAYILEVSSPGVERVLRKVEHFNAVLNEEIYVKSFKPINKCKEFSGILTLVDEKGIKIKIDDNNELSFAYEDIAIAKLVYDFSKDNY